MIMHFKIDEIVKLINKGFDLDLLSFELNIPIEQLQEYKNKLDNEKTKRTKRKTNDVTIKEKIITEEHFPNDEIEEETIIVDYEKIINKYKLHILNNPQNIHMRNLLAFAYLEAGKIENAKIELENLVKEFHDYTSYRQLIYLEKNMR